MAMDVIIHAIDATIRDHGGSPRSALVVAAQIEDMPFDEFQSHWSNSEEWDAILGEDKNGNPEVKVSFTIPGEDLDGVLGRPADYEVIDACAEELVRLGLQHRLCNEEKTVTWDGKDARIKAGIHPPPKPGPKLALTDEEVTLLQELWLFCTHGAEGATEYGYGPAWFDQTLGFDWNNQPEDTRFDGKTAYEILYKLLHRVGAGLGTKPSGEVAWGQGRPRKIGRLR
jgi:hypothetical protein